MRRRIARCTRRVPERSYTFLREGRSAGELNEKLTFNHLPYRLEGVEVKRSERWIDGPRITSEYAIPFIDRWGRITGSTFATVRCSPQQYIATIIATLVRRFRNIAMRKTPHGVVVRFKELLVKAAYYYAVSKNDWFHGRLVELLKHFGENRKTIHGITIKYLAKTDDYTRFVYSQVYFQTNWLFSRALGPRDKSLFFRFSRTFRECGLNGRIKQWQAIRSTSVRVSSLCPQEFRCAQRGES